MAGAPSHKKRKNDGSMTADEKTEMSDSPGSKKQRIKIMSGGRALSPSAVSRQGSPAPGARGVTPAGGDGMFLSLFLGASFVLRFARAGTD